jgi:hypothetical protein
MRSHSKGWADFFRLRRAPPLRPQPNSNYAELIAGIREDNPHAVAAFRNTFTSGIQFWITRESNEVDVMDRVEKVVVSVIQEIKKGNIAGANLPAQILESLRRNIEPRAINRQSANCDSTNESEGAQVAMGLLMAFPELERDALKRYYVDWKTEKEICAELHMTAAEFRDAKSRVRTQFMNTRRQPTRASDQPK